MTTPGRIRVLILEDSPLDAELMVRELKRTGLEVQAERVETEQDFAARLTPDLDLILSDNALPLFGSHEALQLVRARGLDAAFIIVSGAFREDIAAEAARNGADGYLLKDNMEEFAAAVRKALEQRRLRSGRQRDE
jgi:DNA-binding NarL/FixJ family response regulator